MASPLSPRYKFRSLSPVGITQAKLLQMMQSEPTSSKYEKDMLARRVKIQTKVSAIATKESPCAKEKTDENSEAILQTLNASQRNVIVTEETPSVPANLRVPSDRSSKLESSSQSFGLSQVSYNNKSQVSYSVSRISRSSSNHSPAVVSRLYPQPGSMSQSMMLTSSNPNLYRGSPAPTPYYSATQSNSRYPRPLVVHNPSPLKSSLQHHGTSALQSPQKSTSKLSKRSSKLSSLPETARSSRISSHNSPTNYRYSKNKDNISTVEQMTHPSEEPPKSIANKEVILITKADVDSFLPSSQCQVPSGTELSYHATMSKKMADPKAKLVYSDVRNQHINNGITSQMKGSSRVGSLRTLLTARHESKQRESIAEKSEYYTASLSPRILPPLSTIDQSGTDSSSSPLIHYSSGTTKKVRVSTSLFPDCPSPIPIPTSGHLLFEKKSEMQSKDDALKEEHYTSQSEAPFQRDGPNIMSKTTTTVTRIQTMTKKVITTNAVVKLDNFEKGFKQDIDAILYQLTNRNGSSSTEPITIHFKFVNDELAIAALNQLWHRHIPVATRDHHNDTGVQLVSIPQIQLDFTDNPLVTSRTANHVLKLMQEVSVPLPKNKDNIVSQVIYPGQKQAHETIWAVSLGRCVANVIFAALVQTTIVNKLTKALDGYSFEQRRILNSINEEMLAQQEQQLLLLNDTSQESSFGEVENEISDAQSSFARRLVNDVIEGVFENTSLMLAESLTGRLIESALLAHQTENKPE